MKTPTLDEFKQWSAENHDLAMAVAQSQAYAQTMREAVDKIQRKVLEEIPLYDDLDAEQSGAERQRITDPKRTWLSKDDAAFGRYVAECSKRERAAGLKPASMPDDYCPALVAEDLQTKAERALLDSGGALFGFSADQMAGREELWQRGLKLMMGAALKESGGRRGRRKPQRQAGPRLSR